MQVRHRTGVRLSGRGRGVGELPQSRFVRYLMKSTNPAPMIQTSRIKHKKRNNGPAGRSPVTADPASATVTPCPAGAVIRETRGSASFQVRRTQPDCGQNNTQSDPSRGAGSTSFWSAAVTELRFKPDSTTYGVFPMPSEFWSVPR